MIISCDLRSEKSPILTVSVSLICQWRLRVKQFIAKLGVPSLGAGLLFTLFLSWRSRCWDRFAIYSFAMLGSPSWNWAIYETVGNVLVFCCMSYNLMEPSRMLSCSHHHCIITVKKLSELFLASLRSTKFPTSSLNG